ncbi:hypothetical protein PAHAL_2G421700 [Panicum hallii]|uniref:Uncharacterized protein n=1 Tax=Panicum hallii TaxID=206008 RepID=A0A2T8KSI5_9POAL|nr:hypothetical protein PAHAL_2G421700 [Panicum hallii]
MGASSTARLAATGAGCPEGDLRRAPSHRGSWASRAPFPGRSGRKKMVLMWGAHLSVRGKELSCVDCE